MPQLDMTYADFQKHVLATPNITYVMLHGEGESTLHADFESMLNFLHERNIPVRLTTNGTYPYPERLTKLERLIVSIDSLDQAKSAAIGRSNTKKAIEFVEACVDLKIPLEVVSVTGTMNPQEFHQVFLWASKLGVKHRLQKLMAKTDYVKFYPKDFNFGSSPAYQHTIAIPEKTKLTCVYVEKPLMKFITVQNKQLPCCFIKDPTSFSSTASIAADLNKGTVPATCEGCHVIKAAL